MLLRWWRPRRHGASRGTSATGGAATPRRRIRPAVEALEDRLTPVTVAGVTPSLLGGALPAGTATLQVSYSAAVVGGGTAANYELRAAGADGLLGNGDDSLVSLSAGY